MLVIATTLGIGLLAAVITKKPNGAVTGAWRNGRNLLRLKRVMGTGIHRKLPNGKTVSLEWGDDYNGLNHILNGHVAKYWDGVSPGNTAFPPSTTAGDVVRWIDEAILELGDQIRPNLRKQMDLNGRWVEIRFTKDLKVGTFFPLEGPNMFDLID